MPVTNTTTTQVGTPVRTAPLPLAEGFVQPNELCDAQTKNMVRDAFAAFERAGL